MQFRELIPCSFLYLSSIDSGSLNKYLTYIVKFTSYSGKIQINRKIRRPISILKSLYTLLLGQIRSSKLTAQSR
jgi:hypothetical protein